MPKPGKTDWNLAGNDTEEIGDIAAGELRALHEAKADKSKKNLRIWHDYIETLWSAIVVYTGEEEIKIQGEEKKVSQHLEDIEVVLEGDAVNGRVVYQKMWELRNKVHELRIDEGLGIPRRTKLDPEKAAVQGLRNG